MKIFQFTVLLASLFLLSFTMGDKKFPTANLKSLDGKSVNLNASFAKNKLTVISFWATWCSPCKKELDAIHHLYPEWKKLGIEVVAITIDDAQALNKVKPLASQKAWQFTILSDQNKDMLRNLNFQSIPQTFVVDATGTILYTHNGYTPGDEYELEKKLKSFLK
ncbi:MAG: TlpA family protein disulfide reductase [Saprospiraceae bacterium]|nr:TlpA family protein disulfide reductase [Saprospiraceae bacterium]MBK9220637.1 TlpA family protein disulfide reductase [Saprospiraceae bacterium]MBK9729533.1 TlpA family protein disulfide reductase [Saprospiraceae bacterium]